MKLVVYSNVIGHPTFCEILSRDETVTKIRYSKGGETLHDVIANDDIISLIPDVVDPNVYTIMTKKIHGVRGVFDVKKEEQFVSSPDGRRTFFTTDDGRKIEISTGYFDLLTEEEWNDQCGAIHQMMLGGSGI